MAEILTKLVVDLSKPKGDPLREQYLPLTDEELAQHEADVANAQALEAQREAEKQALADLKASAKAKLIAGEPLTADEANTLVI